MINETFQSSPSPRGVALARRGRLREDESAVARRDPLALESDPPPAHDPALLPAALEEISAQQAAIEWLLEANLLSLCLA